MVSLATGILFAEYLSSLRTGLLLFCGSLKHLFWIIRLFQVSLQPLCNDIPDNREYTNT